MKPNTFAFTLIELLVVILIIAILAAVALPQYRFAVQKTRLSEAWIGLKAIRTALETYRLANGSYTLDFTELDIDFPGATYQEYENVSNAKITLSNNTYYILDIDGYVAGHIPQVPSQLEYWYKNNGVKRMGSFYCRTYTPNASDPKQAAQALCKAMGGTLVDENASSSWYLLP